jgi:hypothetical protein
MVTCTHTVAYALIFTCKRTCTDPHTHALMHSHSRTHTLICAHADKTRSMLRKMASVFRRDRKQTHFSGANPAALDDGPPAGPARPVSSPRQPPDTAAAPFLGPAASALGSPAAHPPGPSPLASPASSGAQLGGPTGTLATPSGTHGVTPSPLARSTSTDTRPARVAPPPPPDQVPLRFARRSSESSPPAPVCASVCASVCACVGVCVCVCVLSSGLSLSLTPSLSLSLSRSLSHTQAQTTTTEARPANVERYSAHQNYTPSPYDPSALPFRAGDEITVLDKAESGTWLGELNGRVRDRVCVCVCVCVCACMCVCVHFF